MEVLVAGHLCADLMPTRIAGAYPSPGELVEAGPLAINAGGSVGNTGSALARLDVAVRLEAAVGEDRLGDLLERTLRDSAVGADVALTRAAGYATSYSIVLDRAGGDRSFWHHTGANDSFEAAQGSGFDLVHVGYPTALPRFVGPSGSRFVQSLKLLREAGSTTSIDLSAPGNHDMRALDWTVLLDAALPYIDVISPSLSDLRSIIPDLRRADARAAADWLVSRGAAVAMVTDAARGASLAVAGSERFERGGLALRGVKTSMSVTDVRSVATAVTRTTGAGDVATAGLIWAIIRKLPVDDWATVAMTIAAAHVSGKDISGVALA